MNTPEPTNCSDYSMLGECGRLITTMVERQLASSTLPNPLATLSVLRASHCLSAGELYCYVFLCELIARSQAFIRCEIYSTRSPECDAEYEAAVIAVMNYEIIHNV